LGSSRGGWQRKDALKAIRIFRTCAPGQKREATLGPDAALDAPELKPGFSFLQNPSQDIGAKRSSIFLVPHSSGRKLPFVTEAARIS
jgi:hypothetical protein